MPVKSRKLVCACFVGLLFTVAGSSMAEQPKVTAQDSTNCQPSGKLRGDPANGKALHVEHCAACHGMSGAADVVVMHMDETPKDQSDPDYMKQLPDEYLYLAICKGGAGVGKSYVMSPWGDFFSDQEIRDLIAWVRTFSGT
jgi:mono/diheme cytochrome c family protein